jgi:hypothetical protein
MSLARQAFCRARWAIPNNSSNADPEIGGDPLILVFLFQRRHEHQPADAQTLQLSLPFG